MKNWQNKIKKRLAKMKIGQKMKNRQKYNLKNVKEWKIAKN